MREYQLIINGKVTKQTTSGFIAIIHLKNALKKYSHRNKIHMRKIINVPTGQHGAQMLKRTGDD